MIALQRLSTVPSHGQLFLAPSRDCQSFSASTSRFLPQLFLGCLLFLFLWGFYLRDWRGMLSFLFSKNIPCSSQIFNLNLVLCSCQFFSVNKLLISYGIWPGYPSCSSQICAAEFVCRSPLLVFRYMGCWRKMLKKFRLL